VGCLNQIGKGRRGQPRHEIRCVSVAAGDPQRCAEWFAERFVDEGFGPAGIEKFGYPPVSRCRRVETHQNPGGVEIIGRHERDGTRRWRGEGRQTMAVAP